MEASLLPRRRPPAFRRNFTLGVLNGILFNVAYSFVSSSLVLPGLVRQLGGGHVLVGTLPALEQGGWMLPQLLVGTRIGGLSRKIQVYRVTSVLRVVLYGVLVLVVALGGRLPPTITLACFFLLYGCYAVSSGLAGIPFQEVVAKTIPASRRGGFFGVRQFCGGALTLLLVSPVVRLVLEEGTRWSFPQNYALLYGLSFACIVPALLSFCLIREPASQDVKRSGPLLAQLRLLPALWRSHPDLRRYLAFRTLSFLGLSAEPFYIVYVTEVMGAPAAFVGNYIFVLTVVQIVSYLLWSRLSDRRGNRLLLRLGSGLAASAPLLALLLPHLGGSLGLSGEIGAYLFALVFATSGLGRACLGIGTSNYVLELLPEGERPAGLGLINTISGMLTMLTILAGSLADLLGFGPLFLAALALSAGSFLLSWPLVEPRPAQAIP